MKPLTIRLDPEEIDRLDQEAEERGFGSRAEYIRWMIRNRDSIDSNTTERLDDHEKRIEQLEEKVENGQSE